jgi:hypothetical protein
MNVEQRRNEERRSIEAAKRKRFANIQSERQAIRYWEDFGIRKGVKDALATVVHGVTDGNPRDDAAARKKR